MPSYLDGLNPAQRNAVEHFDHPSLIIAGAGSGKTRVLTCRIAHMIEKGVPPSRILALTFTNKAAREMRERIGTLVPDGMGRYLWMGTFHSIFSRILRAEAETIGFPASFTIYETSDSRNVVKAIVKELNLPEEQYKPKEMFARISFCKNNLVTAASYESVDALVAEDRERRRPQFAEIYKRYTARCKANGAMDFDDLLLYTNYLFRDHPDVLAKYQERFGYILVDEYQDTNYAQYVIIRRLAERHANLCVVGDDAQSIYSFRGAKIENILRFQKDFPHAEVFKLEQNYRSTQTIVNAANSIIRHNKMQLPKNVFSMNDAGEKIRVIKAYTDQEEAQLIVDELRRRSHDDPQAGWSDMAILYRTNAQSRAMEEALRRRGIPYKIYGGTSFYQRKEIKDVIAYIRLVINPADDEAFRRIVNYPARGIGEVTVARIADLAQSEGTSLWDAASRMDPQAPEFKTVGKKISNFVDIIRSLNLGRVNQTLYEFGLEVATRSGIIGSFKMENSPEAASALENIEELLNSMQSFREQRDAFLVPEEDEPGEPTPEEWLQNVALLTDMDSEKTEDREKVTLMTVHAAKGLEFKYVFVVGMEENLFPSLLSLSSEHDLEEERRLFYVAVTRAKRAATLSFAQTRFKWGNMEFCKPSRFLGEIDGKYLDITFDPAEETTGPGGRPPFPSMRQRPSRERFGDRPDTGYVAASSGIPKPVYGSEKPDRQRAGTPDTSRLRSMGTRVKTAPDGGTDPVPVGTDCPAAGSRVKHAKFGPGTVMSVERTLSDLKITVIFDDATVGKKTLLSKYANLQIIENQ